jgi:RHS repeat-associated protein
VTATVTENLGGSNQTLTLNSYDAWGKARPVTGATPYEDPVPGTYLNPSHSGQHEGYAGHENLDDVGLVDMEGRVYDPEVGRFLSPDPNVQYPDSSQGYDRYSYVNDNPLSLSDPSGYFSWGKAVKFAVIAVASYYTFGAVSGYLTTAIGNSAGVCLASTPMAAAIGGGAAAGFVGGGLAGGTLDSALSGAEAGAITGGMENFTFMSSAGAMNAVRAAEQLTMSAVMGCAVGETTGGECDEGAKFALEAQLLKMGITGYVRSASNGPGAYQDDLQTAREGATLKPADSIREATLPYRRDVIDQWAQNVGRAVQTKFSDAIGMQVENADPSVILPGSGTSIFDENSKLMNFFGRDVPGFRAGAVFHDVLMGQMQDSSVWSHVYSGTFSAVTAVPTVIANEYALGLRLDWYAYQNLEKK